MARVCDIPGCDVPPHARRWCVIHYHRWHHHGDAGYHRPTPQERFWAKVNKTDGCWLWTAGLHRGYGKVRVRGTQYLAHRLAYTWLVGPIPDGLTLDHLCRVRSCVRPDHLEPVTNRENWRRGNSPPAHNARKTHCPAGHPYDEANTMRHGGHRSCRSCHARKMAALRTVSTSPKDQEP